MTSRGARTVLQRNNSTSTRRDYEEWHRRGGWGGGWSPRLDVPPAPASAATASAVPVSPGVSKLADGFYSIAGAAVDATGTLYFIDRFFQRIHSWSEAKGLNIVADAPLDAVNLAVDRSGHLLVQSSAGRDASVLS